MIAMVDQEKNLYNFAHANLTSGSPRKAIHLFHTLTLLSPMNPLYWIGLCEACCLENEFYRAEKAYTIASTFVQLLSDNSQEKKSLQENLSAIYNRFQIGV